jgi:RNA polymerase sigma-70 factor (ECF subfamily)
LGDGPVSESRAPDERARKLVERGDLRAAATLIINELGGEVFAFLVGALHNEGDADEVFAATSERLWRSLATFEWRSSLRTWMYVIARNEVARFALGAKRRNVGRVPPAELENVVAAVRTETISALRTAKRDKIRALWGELSVDDRTLLLLRIDSGLDWADIARVFLANEETSTDEDLTRESARLRKRFQLIKRRLAQRAREEGLLQ